ncbi:MAG: sensor histidine kinase [Eubacterium ramulus]
MHHHFRLSRSLRQASSIRQQLADAYPEPADPGKATASRPPCFRQARSSRNFPVPNTLWRAIQEMCYTDPEQAADLIVHFSRYLRTNIDFMDYTDLIPFEKELEHIENYLYIQNTRFGNALVFEKDITVTEFQIPPLSVQPLIENAIKYGIRKNGNHGTIRLETKQTAEGICILVKNSGPGFDEQKINPHHSIQNIRSRMDYLLHGTLIIHSQEGVEGTVMELLLPYQNQT